MAFSRAEKPVFGRLNTDRPHQFKLNGVLPFPTLDGRCRLLRAASGIPISRQTNMVSSAPVFYNGRLSDGRTPWLTLTDMSVQQDIPMPGSRLKGQLSLNVLNLFDQKGVVDVFRVQTRENLPVPRKPSSQGSTFNSESRTLPGSASIRGSSRTVRGRRRVKSASGSS